MLGPKAPAPDGRRRDSNGLRPEGPPAVSGSALILGPGLRFAPPGYRLAAQSGKPSFTVRSKALQTAPFVTAKWTQYEGRAGGGG